MLNPRTAGCKQDGVTDDWQAWQKLVLSAAMGNKRISGDGGSFGNTSVLSQPLFLPTQVQMEHVTFQTRSDFGPIELSSGLILLTNKAVPFTATASDNRFVVPSNNVGGFQASNHSRVAFNALNGETLPAPLVSGKVYYVDTVPTPTTTFTISETRGGPTFDLTTDGAGYAYIDVYELSRVYWDYVRLNLTVPGVNGAWLNLQQPAAVKNLRIEMDVPGTAPYPAATGLFLGGQIGYVENVECNTEAYCRGILVEGYGMVVRNFNDNGVGNNDVGIEVVGHGVGLDTLWTETCGTAGVLVSGPVRGLDFSGSWLHAGTGMPALKVTSTAASFSMRAHLHTTSGTQGQLLIDHCGRKLYVHPPSGPAQGDQVTDYHASFKGMTQGEYMGPVLLDRTQAVVKSAYTVRRTDQTVIADSGADTVTLPTAVGWSGSRHTIKRKGTNDVTVMGSQKIDGADSYQLSAQYQYVTVESDGAAWYVVANN